MMRARLLFSVLLTGASLSPAPALEFEPTRSFRELEGMRIPVLLFPDGARRIRYEPPDGWAATGQGATISFHPKAVAMAELKLTVSPKTPARSGDPVGQVPAPRDALQSFLPPDATKVEAISECVNPFILETIGSREAVFAYSSGGQRCRISIATCDLNVTQWLCVVTNSFERDFEEVRHAALGSMFSWSAR